MNKIKFFLLTLLFLINTSCHIHTFNFGDGPKENNLTVFKQNNFIGGLISNDTPKIEETNNGGNYRITIKKNIVDTILTIFSFGLYSPTTIILTE